jgi:hypothetical protein
VGLPDNSFKFAGAKYHIGPSSIEQDQSKIRSCAICRGCKQLLQPMPKGERLPYSRHTAVVLVVSVDYVATSSKIQSCDMCRGCKQLLQPMPKGDQVCVNFCASCTSAAYVLMFVSGVSSIQIHQLALRNRLACTSVNKFVFVWPRQFASLTWLGSHFSHEVGASPGCMICCQANVVTHVPCLAHNLCYNNG